jgi:hypothetical protein
MSFFPLFEFDDDDTTAVVLIFPGNDEINPFRSGWNLIFDGDIEILVDLIR